ncbi:putative ribonuclease H-like domain-containing protein [Tanacetum coccineum]
MLGEVSIHMLVEKKYPLPQDTLMRMLQWKLHVKYNVTKMAYGLLRGGLLGINLHSTAKRRLILLSEVRDNRDKDYLEMKIRRIDQGLGSTSGIRAFALRNFDLEVMEFESAQSNTTAKLPILKLENGTSVTKMSVPVTAEEKTNKKNDVNARSLLVMALPNEHQLTFNQYSDAKTMFTVIESRFGGNEATKKTQKTLLAILGVFITQEDLNSKFLRSLPLEWNTYVVVWMYKADIETMSIDDLYNNFKIIEQDVKKSVGASSGAQNLAFMTAPSTSSTNDVNTASPAYEVSTVSPNINTACPQVSTANFSDNTVYAFMVENPNGSNLLQQDLEKIHEDDLKAMDLKWQLSLLSMRAKRYFLRTGKKIFINANDTTGYDKFKVECFNCHKMGHFSRECRAPRNKEGQFRNQYNTRKQGNNKDTSSKTMLAIDGVATTYKRGLATLEEQLITYRKNEVLFSEEVAVLKREVACKDYEINVLKSEFEKVKQEKEGYNVVPPPHPLIYNRPKNLDLSYSGLDELKNPEFKGYGSENINTARPKAVNTARPHSAVINSVRGLEQCKDELHPGGNLLEMKKEIEKMVDEQENVVNDSSIPRNDESNIPGTRIEPRSDKESLEVEIAKEKEVEITQETEVEITQETPVVNITNVVIPVNVNDEDEEITSEVYELKRREKGKIVEETRNSPIPTPIRSPRIHTNIVSSDTNKEGKPPSLTYKYPSNLY